MRVSDAHNTLGRFDQYMYPYFRHDIDSGVLTEEEAFDLVEELSLIHILLLASTMSSTDSASVFSILRSKKQGLKQNLRPLLELSLIHILK